MKKKVLVLAMAACLAAGMVGCSKGKEKEATPKDDKKVEAPANKEAEGDAAANKDMAEGDAANKDMAEMPADAAQQAAEAVDPSQAQMASEIEGTFKSKAEDGEFINAVFTDADGNDFVAVISKDTEKPGEELAEGKKYKVYHDGTMATSEPPQYTNVVKIEAVE